MNRYSITDIVKNYNGKRKYTSLKYPVIPERDSDIYLYAKRMMRLDLLANTYYGDVTLWPIIARANNIGYGTLFLEPGIRIRIPYPLTESDVIEAFYEINEIN